MTPAVLAIIAALVSGGGVAFYHARPRRESIIAEASRTAVEVVNAGIEHLEKENVQLHKRIRDLERDQYDHDKELAEAMRTIAECREHIRRVTAAVIKLGGEVDAAGNLIETS